MQATSIGVLKRPCEFFSRPVGVSSAHRGEFKKRLLSTDLDGGYGPGEPRGGREPGFFYNKAWRWLANFEDVWNSAEISSKRLFDVFHPIFGVVILDQIFQGDWKHQPAIALAHFTGPSGGQIQQTSRTGMELTWCFRIYLTQQK